MTMTAADRAFRRAQRLDDPRFEKLRNPRSRRRLVVALVGLLVVEAAAFALSAVSLVLFASLLALVVVLSVLCLGLLKASTRGVEELPETALDERQWQIRGLVYARAYKIGRLLLTAELLVAALWIVLALPTPSSGVLIGALLLPFHTAVVLPTLTAAWHRTV